MNNFYLSIIIPTKNRIKYLKQCLNSLLKQSYKGKFEIIIIDDGSTEIYSKKYKRIIKNTNSSKIKYIRQNCLGPGIARNNGVKHSKGNIIVFMDDDCTAPKSWLSNIAQNFSKDRHLSILGGPVILKFDKTSPFNKLNDYFFKKKKKLKSRYYSNCIFLPFNTLITANFAIRKTHFNKLRGFEKKYSYLADDVSIFYKALSQKNKILFNKNIYVFHLYSENFMKLLIEKCYRYGKVDVITYNDFFKNHLTLEIKLLQTWNKQIANINLNKFPLTIYINLDFFKIFLLVSLTLLVYTNIYYLSLFLLIILCYSLFSKKQNFLHYVCFAILTNFFIFLGRLHYSLKYKIVCI